MFLSCISLEKRAIRTLCSDDPEISALMMSQLTEADFYFQPAKEVFNRIDLTLKQRGEYTVWEEVLNHPAISETTRKIFAKHRKRPLTDSVKIGKIADKLHEFTRIRALYDIEETIAKAIKAEKVDTDELLTTVAGKLEKASSNDRRDSVEVVWDRDDPFISVDWVVDGIFSEGHPSLLVGQTQAGKTFKVLDLMVSVAMGEPFMGRDTKQGGSLVVLAESAGSFPGRKNAARLGKVMPAIARGITGAVNIRADDLPIVAIKRRRVGNTFIDIPNLNTEAGVRQLIVIAKKTDEEMMGKHMMHLRLIVIDTLLSAFKVDDLNSPGEGSRIMKVMARIAEETRIATILVHHHGKEVGRGAAGTYALTALAENVLTILCEKDKDDEVKRRWAILTKVKEGKTGYLTDFRLDAIKVGANGVGKDVYSCYTVDFQKNREINNDPRDTYKQPELSKPEKRFNDFIALVTKCVKTAGVEIQGEERRGVKRTTIIDTMANLRAYRDKPRDSARKAVERFIAKGIAEGRLGTKTIGSNDWYWVFDDYGNDNDASRANGALDYYTTI
jgi:hypothetical protein